MLSECGVVELPLSTVQRASGCVQSTPLPFVGFSVFLALRSVDTPVFRRLFGVLRPSFS
ncbi:hypothetical protein [Trichococcus flocculiformis]|uniref:hypothetical protein n=1 Tax=Trichococcus flocculiformis TaxID=82803 RepID=UPI0015A51BFC|nr:hypothetical protein [Trichococcus flocculiformis]